MGTERHSVRFTPYRPGVRAEVEGECTLAATIAYWREVAAEIARTGADRLLLVDHIEGDLEADEWHRLVQAMAGQGLEDVRIAHVKPWRALPAIEYCEIHAREAGIDSRVFSDEAAADLWLRYGSE